MRVRAVTTLFAIAATSLAALTACGSATPGSLSSPAATNLAIYPSSTDLDPGQQMRFEPAPPDVTGTTTWSVLEADGGTVDRSGAYTAPETEGTFHVVATFGALHRTTKAEIRVKRGVRVAVTPQTASIAAGATLTLTATVTGTSNTAVTWSVSEGSTGGTVAADGVYTAPATSGTYHVVATSVAAPTRSNYATVTVTAPPAPPPPAPAVSVAVSPSTASVAASGTVQFSATVSGSSNTAVTWSVQEGSAGGSVDTTGLYTAPAAAGTFHVVATASADSSQTAVAAVTVSAPPPTAVVSVAISPTTASVAAGGTQQFKTTVSGSTNTAVTWSVQEGAAGGSVNASGLYTAPATAGTYHVIATSAADTSKSAAATVTVTAAPPPPTTGTTPPDSGTVAWAPASGDTSFVNVKNYGAVGDGTTDDTAAFNNAAATGKKLYVPKPSAYYKLTGRIALLNSIYGDGSMPEFRMFGATGDRAHAMLFVSGHSGSTALVIQGLTLDGQWNGGSQGEWSANVDIRGASTNVLVQYNTLKNPYGDCVQLADDTVGPVTNITIRKNNMVNPYRCDVSFQWVDGVIVDGNSFNKNNTYVDAVDVEPCGGTPQYDNNIQITNNVFDIPISRTLSLVNGSGYGGSNITVTGNSGSAQDKPIWDSGWNNVNISNNSWSITYP